MTTTRTPIEIEQHNLLQKRYDSCLIQQSLFSKAWGFCVVARRDPTQDFITKKESRCENLWSNFENEYKKCKTIEQSLDKSLDLKKSNP